MVKGSRILSRTLTLLLLMTAATAAAGHGSPAAAAAGVAYYVDATAGSDANAGTSPGAPWKSLAKVNGTTFQAGDQVLPLIENMRIVDHLASDAAEEERHRIARSVHDRVIQPYLGLQLGLKALQQELSPKEARASFDSPDKGLTMLDQLVGMTREGIEELRKYVGDLKQTHMDPTPLVESIRRFAGKFESGTGIHVEIVDGVNGMLMNDRLAAEVFQMTAEALSNVHRHTDSRNVTVGLTMADNSLVLTIENDAPRELPALFTPLSIFERAEALGARTEVASGKGKTRVRVEVPL